MSVWRFSQIPKIAHFYWGVGKLPLSRYLTLWSFRQQNPDWEMRLYRPTQKQAFGRVYSAAYDGPCYLDQAQRICEIRWIDFGIFGRLWDVHKSDLLRWHLLHSVGGIWSDMDIFYINTCSSLMTDNLTSGRDVELLLCYNKQYSCHSIGFIGSTQGQAEMGAISSSCGTYFEPHLFQSIGSEMLSGTGLSDVYIESNMPRISNIKFFSIYQLGVNALSMLHDAGSLRFDLSSILGFHWYAGSPLSIPFQNSANLDSMLSLGSYLSGVVGDSGYMECD